MSIPTTATVLVVTVLVTATRTMKIAPVVATVVVTHATDTAINRARRRTGAPKTYAQTKSTKS